MHTIVTEIGKHCTFVEIEIWEQNILYGTRVTAYISLVFQANKRSMLNQILITSNISFKLKFCILNQLNISALSLRTAVVLVFVVPI